MGKKSRTYKSWRDKLENPPPGLPKVVTVPASWAKRMGGRRVLVPTPLLVDELIRKVKKGKLITTKQIRARLAEPFKADTTCPLVTGIHVRIAAEAAEEDLRNGKKQITPYWRVIGTDGSLNPKLPGGTETQAAKLKQEGHRIAAGKKPPKVQDFEKALVKLTA
jgi:hypothetical protein